MAGNKYGIFDLLYEILKTDTQGKLLHRAEDCPNSSKSNL
jgi:hypothetical protein